MSYQTPAGKAMEYLQCTKSACQKVDEFDQWLDTLDMQSRREVLAILNWEFSFREIPGFNDKLDNQFSPIINK